MILLYRSSANREKYKKMKIIINTQKDCAPTALLCNVKQKNMIIGYLFFPNKRGRE